MVQALATHMDQLSSQDQILIKIKSFHETKQIPTFDSRNAERRFLKKASQYYLTSNQRMFHRNGTKAPSLVILDSEARERILEEAHENLGHNGEQSVYELLRLRVFWPYLRTHVHQHVSSCHECQRRRVIRMIVPPTISMPATIFEKVYVDVMYMQPPAGGYSFIVCAWDDLTGVVEASPLSQNNSNQLAHFFWTKIYCQYGAIGHVVTDNGSEVKGAFERLMKRANIPQVRISSYNKHGTGAVEHGHLVLREAIVKACPKTRKGQIKNWHEYIDIAMFADRVTTSRVTGFTPYFLLHGVEPLLPLDLAEATFMVEGFQSGMTTSELLGLRIRQLTRHPADLERAANMLKSARIQSRNQYLQRYKRRLQKDEYKPGELVLVQNSRLEMTVNRFKTDPRYLGPYEVVQKTAGGAYKLQELDGAIFDKSIAAFWLLPYVT